MECAIEECDRPVFCRGWCSMHYGRWQRHGDPTVTKRYEPRPDRLSDRVLQWQNTGLAVCQHHGEHDEWAFYTKGKPGQAGSYRALQCQRCTRARTRRYVAANAPEVRAKQMTVHARAVRAVTSTRKRAASKGWDFDLTVEWVEQQHDRQGGQCAYTGREFDHTDMRRAPDSMTLERVDPTKGYTQANVLLVCWQANLAKSDMTLSEFGRLCGDVVGHLRALP